MVDNCRYDLLMEWLIKQMAFIINYYILLKIQFINLHLANL